MMVFGCEREFEVPTKDGGRSTLVADRDVQYDDGAVTRALIDYAAFTECQQNRWGRSVDSCVLTYTPRNPSIVGS